MLRGVFVVATTVGLVAGAKPNIVYVVTDDQDQMLGSSFPKVFDATPLAKTEELVVKRGMTFENMFIHVPICNPSRSTTLTGRYLHNIKTTGTAWAAMHVDMDRVHNSTFAVELQGLGYATGLFGKYSNAMPTYVPRGWDAWLANGGGSYVSPTFQVLNGSDVTFQGDYSTAVIGNTSLEWIESRVKKKSDDDESPFFAYVAPKACHEPFNPAPWYAEFWDPSWPEDELRGPAWNASYATRADHAANVPDQPTLSEQAAVVTRGIFRNRWRTLLSVDDVVAALVGAISLDTDYLFFTSDHGFHTGHMNMIMDKRHAYDFDVRVHLVVAGPGIRPNSRTQALATNVDLAPTFLALATGAFFSGAENAQSHYSFFTESPVVVSFDGRALTPVLFDTSGSTNHSSPVVGWNRSFVLIEYYYNDPNQKCVGSCNASVVSNDYPSSDANCVSLDKTPNADCWGNGCSDDCYLTETTANNFVALRLLNHTHNLLYAKYQNGSQTLVNISFDLADFAEVFDVYLDPWQLTNLAPNGSVAAAVDAYPDLDRMLMDTFACQGSAQCP